jgi:hypothetical protein
LFYIVYFCNVADASIDAEDMLEGENEIEEAEIEEEEEEGRVPEGDEGTIDVSSCPECNKSFLTKDNLEVCNFTPIITLDL